MTRKSVNQRVPSHAGEIVRHWRLLRKRSQMDLALDVGVSTRHLSFVETGRARPGRELLLNLAAELELPLRQRNGLLLAAGYAPEFSVAKLDAQHVSLVNEAIRHMLSQHEPFLAVVFDARYDIVLTNHSYARVVATLAGGKALTHYANIYRLMFANDGLRPYVDNWAVLEQMMLARLSAEAVSTQEPALMQLYDDLTPPNHQDEYGHAHLDSSLPVVQLTLKKGSYRASFFSTLTTFGAPLDVTTQELRIESLFPADLETRTLLTQDAENARTNEAPKP